MGQGAMTFQDLLVWQKARLFMLGFTVFWPRILIMEISELNQLLDGSADSWMRIHAAS